MTGPTLIAEQIRESMEEDLRESMEEDVRTSKPQDTRTSIQPDTQLSTQQIAYTSLERRAQTSGKLDLGVSRMSVAATLGGTVETQGSTQGFSQGSEYLKSSTEAVIQGSTRREADRQSTRSLSPRSSPPSLFANIRSAAPTVAGQYTTATPPTSLKGLIKGAVVTLAEAATANYYVRSSGKDGAGTHIAVEEWKQGVRKSEGMDTSSQTIGQTAIEAATSSSREIMTTTTESVQQDNFSSPDIVQTAERPTAVENEKLTYAAIVGNKRFGREASLDTMVSSAGQNPSTSIIQGSTIRSTVSSSHNTPAVTVQTSMFMETTVGNSEDHNSDVLSSTVAEEETLDHDVTSEGSIQTFDVGYSLSAEMNRVEASDSSITLRDTEQGCEYHSCDSLITTKYNLFSFT